MSDNTKMIVVNAALAISSGWTLYQCSDLNLARIAFGLYLADGILGTIECVLPDSNRTLMQVHDVVGRIARPLYLPLIVGEAIMFGAGMDEMYAYGHLVFPGVYLLLTEILDKQVKKEMLDLNFIINTASLGYSSFVKESIYGGICALVNLAAFLATKEDSMEFLVLIGIANVAAAQFFKQIFG